MNKRTWLIDSGHGGFINGEYTTAPAKMYRHSPEEVFYEGVFNREIKQGVMHRAWDLGLECVDVCATELDLPLSVRVNIINAIYEKYPNAVLLSLHSNAGGGTGFEIWTSYGQTRSDSIAQIVAEQFAGDFQGIKIRSDTSDGDIDKEAAFYILKHSRCPAVLPECLFYDNYSDYRKLIDPDFKDRYIESLITAMVRVEATLSV